LDGLATANLAILYDHLVSILQPLEIFYGHLLYFVVIWYTFPRFGILDEEKSGNPASDPGLSSIAPGHSATPSALVWEVRFLSVA
jgi:hypothetical protein